MRQMNCAGCRERERSSWSDCAAGGQPAADFAQALYAGDRGQPVLHRGDRAPPARTPASQVRPRRASATCSASGCPTTSREVISRRLARLEPGHDRGDAGGVGDRPRLRRRAAGGCAGARRGRLPGRARGGAGGRAGGRVASDAGRLHVLAHADPRDAVRGHVRPRAGPACTAASAWRWSARAPSATPTRWRYHFTRAAERRGRRAGDPLRAGGGRAGHDDAGPRAGRRPLRPRARGARAVRARRRLARRCELLLELGEARVRSGERRRAWPAFREAAALAARAGRRARRWPGRRSVPRGATSSRRAWSTRS